MAQASWLKAQNAAAHACLAPSGRELAASLLGPAQQARQQAPQARAPAACMRQGRAAAAMLWHDSTEVANTRAFACFREL